MRWNPKRRQRKSARTNRNPIIRPVSVGDPARDGETRVHEVIVVKLMKFREGPNHKT